MRNGKVQIVLRLALLALFSTFIAGQTAEEFGIVRQLKNYPEYKRGVDPWTNLSGTLQENVDTYSGKLNITYNLPGIPWSETSSFSPVLRYNSNIWSYAAPLARMTVGGVTGKMGTLIPWDHADVLEKGSPIKVAEYWSNDAWMRFSYIGRPHNMPGWSLAIGGVYTEYSINTSPVGYSPGEDRCDFNGKPRMERKYFVAPDGSSHLLVDTETHCRPYIPSTQTCPPNANYDECQWYNCGVVCAAGESVCTPLRGAIPPGGRVWLAVDGSGFYYVESLEKVYGKDGTCYDLNGRNVAVNPGLINKITDLKGNAITIAVSAPPPPPTDLNTLTVVYSNGRGATLTINYLRVWLPYYKVIDGENTALDQAVYMLESVTAPGANNSNLVFNFFNQNLVDHLSVSEPGYIRFSDIFRNPKIMRANSGEPIALPNCSNDVFCKRAGPVPSLNESNNSQIFVLTGIGLPDGRQITFRYNRAGKITQVNYPDGGWRRYEYANTPEASFREPIDEMNNFDMWYGLYPGEAPLGNVGLVWKSEGQGEQLERAYAYSGYPGVTEPEGGQFAESLEVMGDGSSRITYYYPPEPETSGDATQHIIKFGLTDWRAGKTLRVRQFRGRHPQLFDWATPAGQADYNLFLQRFLNYVETTVDQPPPNAYFAACRGMMGGTGAGNYWREEQNEWSNHGEQWHWTLPPGTCTTWPAACANGGPARDWYGLVIPGPGESWDSDYFSRLLLPEWNPVVNRKWSRIREGGQGDPLVTMTETIYDDVPGPAGLVGWNGLPAYEWNARPAYEWIYVNNQKVRGSHTTYATHWYTQPEAGQIRLLGLPLVTETLNGAGTVVATTQNTYCDPDPSNPTRYFPGVTSVLKDVATGLWGRTFFTYETGPVRPKTVKSLNTNGIANTMVFSYENGFLRKVDGCEGDSSTAKLWMMMEYDTRTGLLTRRTDRNGGGFGDANDWVKFVCDNLGRPTATILHNGSNSAGVQEYTVSTTSYGYEDGVAHSTRIDNGGAGAVRTTQVMNDALGRPAHKWVTIGDQVASTSTRYDVLGRAEVEYLPGAGSLDSWTPSPGAQYIRHVYDPLGRETATLKPSPAGVNEACSASVTYGMDFANYWLTEEVKDEATRIRKIRKDLLGRIIQVEEPGTTDQPGVWLTDYGYDDLDHLLSVNKRAAGSLSGQGRSFVYNAAGELQSATLPEYDNQTMLYTYDLLGNLKVKQLGGYVENMDYDPFGRLTSRVVNHSGKQTSYAFQYDTALAVPGVFATGPYIWGRLVKDSATHQDGVTITRYFAADWRGLPAQKTEVFTSGGPGEVFHTFYDQYDNLGNPTQVTYPSGDQVNLAYGTGAVLTSVSLGGNPIFSGIEYALHGAPKKATWGPGGSGGSIDWIQSFNARQWPQQLVLGNDLFKLAYSGYENNGNITDLLRTANQGGISRSRSFHYSYDPLNRLRTFNYSGDTPDAGYTYDMDEFGNLLAQRLTSGGGGGAPAPVTVSVSRSTNRLEGKQHDLLGNVLNLDNTGTLFAEYLDQGHIDKLSASQGGPALWRYYYDADGKRRIKAPNSGTDITTNASYSFYEGENLVCEQDRGSQIQQTAGYYDAKYLVTDHLGTTRAELKFENNAPKIKTLIDTMPYGELLPQPDAQTSEKVLFSGKQRDPETGLDFFGARFYSDLGRWNSPDPFDGSAKICYPISWNRYNYCKNNPIIYIDEDGKDNVLAPGLDDDQKNRLITALAQAYRNPKFKAKFDASEKSDNVWIIGPKKLPNTYKDDPKKSKTEPGLISFGETLPNTDGKVALPGGTVSYSPENIDYVKSTSQKTSDVETLAHEFYHQATTEANGKFDDIEETLAQVFGKEVAKDKNTKKKPSKEEMQQMEKLLTPKSGNAKEGGK